MQIAGMVKNNLNYKLLLITGGSTLVVLGVMLFGFWGIWQDLTRLEHQSSAVVIAHTVPAHTDKAADPQATALSALHAAVSRVVDGMRQRILMTMLGLGGAVIVAFVWFELVLRRAVLRPARCLVDDLSRMALGDFSRPVAVTTGDEIGQVARSAADVQRRLAEVLGGLDAATGQVAVSAGQLQGVARSASEGAEEQRGQTGEMASAMAQMSVSVQQIARHTVEAAEATREADHEADSGRRVFTRTAQAIRGLADEVERASGVIQRLHAKSTEIGAVLDVIRGIAEQTNLLALNAAIEAARAGSQGRGFAVVADEVRTLASRTQTSTAEIQAMIEQLQAGAQEAVAVMAKGHQQAGETVTQAAEAERALGVINDAVSRIAGLSREIASAAEEQSAVVELVNARVEGIRHTSETAAEGATETLSASEGLMHLSEGLRQEVGRFRLPRV